VSLYLLWFIIICEVSNFIQIQAKKSVVSTFCRCGRGRHVCFALRRSATSRTITRLRTAVNSLGSVISLHQAVLCTEQTLYRIIYIKDYSDGPLMSNGTYPFPQEARTNITLHHDADVYMSHSHMFLAIIIIQSWHSHLVCVFRAKQGRQDYNIANHEYKTSGYPQP
jgi:hypothetical protein